MATAPPLPHKTTAADGAGRPSAICFDVSSYIDGTWCTRARAANPMVVPNTKGMGNHALPPSRNPRDAVAGNDAIERW